MGYGLPLTTAARVETIGVSGGAGTTVTGSGTGGAYGSLTTIGTTGFGYDGFWVQIQAQNSRYNKYTITAATGGGADETIVEDAFVSMADNNSANRSATAHWFPVRVAAGATIKVKLAASGAGSAAALFSIIGYQGNQNLIRGFSRAVSLTDYAANSTTPANTITMSGTTLTGWVQLCATTSQAVEAIGLCVNGCGNTTLTNAQYMLELGYGGSGSEVSTGILVTATGAPGAGLALIATSLVLPYFIPAGTRLAMRGQMNNSGTPTMALSAWGFQR